MSEYQYCEFRAIDRPLSASEGDQLRAITTHARITAISFVNTYDYRDLKADPLKLLERYFDSLLLCGQLGNTLARHAAFQETCQCGGVEPVPAQRRFGADTVDLADGSKRVATRREIEKLDQPSVWRHVGLVGRSENARPDREGASQRASANPPPINSASPPAMISSFAGIVLRVPSPTQARTLGRAYRNLGRARSTRSSGGSNPPSER
jgi:hypothetical protein